MSKPPEPGQEASPDVEKASSTAPSVAAAIAVATAAVGTVATPAPAAPVATPAPACPAPAIVTPAKPGWLPEILTLPDPMNGTGMASLNGIYKQQLTRGLKIEGKEVWWNSKVRPGETCEESFIHLITRGPPGSRSYDQKRAERLCWVLPAIRNHGDTVHVKKWYYQQADGTKNLYIWIENHDYVLVFEVQTKRDLSKPAPATKEILFLLSAYHIDGDSSRMKFRKKYEARITR